MAFQGREPEGMTNPQSFFAPYLERHALCDQPEAFFFDFFDFFDFFVKSEIEIATRNDLTP